MHNPVGYHGEDNFFCKFFREIFLENIFFLLHDSWMRVPPGQGEILISEKVFFFKHLIYIQGQIHKPAVIWTASGMVPALIIIE